MYHNTTTHQIGLMDFLTIQDQPDKKACPPKPPKVKENTMFDLPEEKVYLMNRLETLKYNRIHDELKPKYNMVPDPSPKTYTEMRERLEKGKFTLPSDALAKERGFTDIDRLTWQDPAKPADPEGFRKALKAVEEVATKARDVIVVKTPEEGLKSLQEFETATLH